MAVRFLWASLQLDLLCDECSDHDIEESLSDLPAGLYETYGRITDRIARFSKRRQALAAHALSWVVYSYRPLLAKELVEAVSIDPLATGERNNYTKEDILNTRQNLLVEENDIIGPIHYSVQEYFTLESASAYSGFCSLLEPRLAHARLAKICLRYLSHGNAANQPSANWVDLFNSLKRYPILWYSSHFFDKHLVHISESPEDVQQALDVFLGSEDERITAMFQARYVPEWDGHSAATVMPHFVSFSTLVNAPTVILSTALFQLPHLRVSGNLPMKLELPKYILHQACRGGVVGSVAYLVEERGCDIQEKDEEGETPLHCAALRGHKQVVQWLLERAGDIDPRSLCIHNDGQERPARSHKELRLSQVVNAQGGWYGHALQAASAMGHKDIVKLLLDNGADINAHGGMHGSALQAASVMGHKNIVELLLDRSADIYAQGGLYGSSLNAAAYNGHLELLRLLIEDRFADRQSVDGEGRTALHLAARGGHIATVNYFLKQGLDHNAVDSTLR